MSFLFRLNDPTMKLQMEKKYFYVVYHAIMKVRVAPNFFLIFWLIWFYLTHTLRFLDRWFCPPVSSKGAVQPNYFLFFFLCLCQFCDLSLLVVSRSEFFSEFQNCSLILCVEGKAWPMSIDHKSEHCSHLIVHFSVHFQYKQNKSYKITDISSLVYVQFSRTFKKQDKGLR